MLGIWKNQVVLVKPADIVKQDKEMYMFVRDCVKTGKIGDALEVLECMIHDAETAFDEIKENA